MLFYKDGPKQDIVLALKGSKGDMIGELVCTPNSKTYIISVSEDEIVDISQDSSTLTKGKLLLVVARHSMVLMKVRDIVHTDYDNGIRIMGVPVRHRDRIIPLMQKQLKNTVLSIEWYACKDDGLFMEQFFTCGKETDIEEK